MPSVRWLVFMVQNRCFQYFDRRKSLSTGLDFYINGDDVQFDGISVSVWVVPVCQRIKTVINHGLRRYADSPDGFHLSLS